MNLPRNKYDVVLVDPPWSYYGQQDKWGAAAKFYPTMTDEEILKIDLQSVLTDRGILFLWATSPRLNLAMSCIESWGLHYRGISFVWVKTKRSDPKVPIGAQGVRPSITKPTTELVLAASRVMIGRPLKLYDESIQQVVLAPKREHSQKPDEIQDRIERMYPNSNYLELFARRPRVHWDVWGNEVES